MNIVDMQPAVLAPSFPVSDTRPSPASPYLDHKQYSSQYADSRHSSKENRTPPFGNRRSSQSSHSPQSNQGTDAPYGPGQVNGHQSPQHNAVSRKRSANGNVKEPVPTNLELSRSVREETPNVIGPAPNTNHVGMVEVSARKFIDRTASNLVQLSQQLRTRLTYAMVKVQNGWQNRSLDEVESLASASPRSTTFNHYSDYQHLLSPRAAISAHLTRQSSDSSTDSAHSQPQIRSQPFLMSPPMAKKGLAPPANIVSRQNQQRRRPTPNMQVQTSLGAKLHSQTRPSVNQRTPSQNAAMEADAVETLMFMASPNNSGHHSAQFSPVTSAPSLHNFPSQANPLRNTFSAPTSPKRVAFASNNLYTPKQNHDKNAVIASLIERLDEEGDADLDEALKLMDRYHATKVTT